MTRLTDYWDGNFVCNKSNCNKYFDIRNEPESYEDTE